MEDLSVVYRMCGISSTNPSPFYQNDKFKLNTVCLRSFIMGFRDINIKVHFILDFCDERYDELVKEYGTFEHSEDGINKTMLKSYDLASKEKGYVLFQECDYLYRPNIGRKYVLSLNELDIVSPYDHRNFYIDRNLHSQTCDIVLIEDQHFRSVERNTMTWGTHSDVIREYREIFDKYGYLDNQVWSELLIAGKTLWNPIPSFATHCVKDFLSPGVDWSFLWKAYQ